MKCDLVQDRLSAFIDNEVGVDEQLRIEQHLKTCESCRSQVSQFLAIGNLMRQSEQVVDTDAVWNRVSGHFGNDPHLVIHSQATSPILMRKWVYAILATAASLAIFSFVASRSRLGDLTENGDLHAKHEHAALAVDFQEVFRSAQKEPRVAVAKLVAKYQGQELNKAETITYLGYEPALFRSLPAGFTRASTHVLNMPCCKCSATICERRDGTSLVVFEHKEEQPMWFGDASSIETQCAGQTCKIIESAGQLAVSWKSHDRQLTMIGANDISEVSTWVETMKL
jgi:Putative zinc-finger